jgi:hypothetical protein
VAAGLSSSAPFPVFESEAPSSALSSNGGGSLPRRAARRPAWWLLGGRARAGGWHGGYLKARLPAAAQLEGGSTFIGLAAGPSSPRSGRGGRWRLSWGPPDGRAPPRPRPLKSEAGSSRGDRWRNHLFAAGGCSVWSCLGCARWCVWMHAVDGQGGGMVVSVV